MEPLVHHPDFGALRVSRPTMEGRCHAVADYPAATHRRSHIVRRLFIPIVMAGAIAVIPAATAWATTPATTPPNDPNDVTQVDNPLDENDDDSGFDDWGLLGLLGLVGLAGLAGRKRNDVRTYDDRTTTTR